MLGMAAIILPRDASAAPTDVLDHPDSRGEGRPDNQAGDPYDLYSCNGKTEDRDNVLVENAWPPIEFFAGVDWKGNWGIDIEINPFWDEFSFILDSLGSKNPEPSITPHVSPSAAIPGQSIRISTEATNFQSNQADIRMGWCMENLQKQFCKIFGIVTTSSGRPEDCSGSISVQSLAAGGSLDNLVRMDGGRNTGEGAMTCCGVLSRRPFEDVNGDGVDDDWVRRYFGMDPANPFNPNQDVDGDGWTAAKVKKNPLVVPGVKAYNPAQITGDGSDDPIEPGDLGQDPNDPKFERPPFARMDSVAGTPGRPIDINVLENDSDANRNIDAATLHIAQSSEPGAQLSGDGNPEHGNVQVRSNGVITYTSLITYEGNDVFYYTICDTTDLCDYWTAVNVTISAGSPAVSVDDPIQNFSREVTSKLRSLIAQDAIAAPIPVKNCSASSGVFSIGDNCFSNIEEYIWGTNPWDADTDDDGVPDEADIAGTGQIAVPFTWPQQLELPYLQFRIQTAGISTKSSFFGGSSDLMKMDSEPIRVYRGQHEPLRVILSTDQREVAISSSSQVNLLARVSSPSDLQEGFLDFRWQVSIDGHDPIDLLECPGGLGNNQCIADIRRPSDSSICQSDEPLVPYCPGQHVEFIVTGTVKTNEMILTGLPIVPQYGNSSSARVAIQISPTSSIIQASQDGSLILSDTPDNPSVFLASSNIPVEFEVISVEQSNPQDYFYEWLRDDIVDVAQSGVGKNTAVYVFGSGEEGNDDQVSEAEIFPIEKIQVRTVHLDREREYSRDMIRIQAKKPTVVVTNPDNRSSLQAGSFELAYGSRPTLNASLKFGRGPVVYRWLVDGEIVHEGSSYHLPSLSPGSHALSIESYRPHDPKTIISSVQTPLEVSEPVNPKERAQFAVASLSSKIPSFSRLLLLVSIVFGGVFLFFHFLTKAHYSAEK